jgi:hydrogenase maturation protein HypF
MPARDTPLARHALRVQGAVQGVGYRPFVYRLAQQLGLQGWVLNDAEGVLIEAQGPASVLEDFAQRLRSDAPPLARVERVQASIAALRHDEQGFSILASRAGAVSTDIPPDTATCADCLAELFDPLDRRWRHPFINCTNCGPRYTLTRALPYDRAMTSMAGFAQCPACLREYTQPEDRRFHAEPNACPVCGPQISLVDAQGHSLLVPGADPIAAALQRCCCKGRSSPSRAWAAFIWPATRTMPRPWRGCACASSATKSRLR